MKILVDTSIWSLALRRKESSQNPVVIELAELILEVRVQMLGAVRQELLCGIKSPSQFKKLQHHLRAFPDLELSNRDYETAAEFFNLCRSSFHKGCTSVLILETYDPQVAKLVRVLPW